MTFRIFLNEDYQATEQLKGAKKRTLLQVEVNLYSHEDKVWVNFHQLAGDIQEFLEFYHNICSRCGFNKEE